MLKLFTIVLTLLIATTAPALARGGGSPGGPGNGGPGPSGPPGPGPGTPGPSSPGPSAAPTSSSVSDGPGGLMLKSNNHGCVPMHDNAIVWLCDAKTHAKLYPTQPASISEAFNNFMSNWCVITPPKPLKRVKPRPHASVPKSVVSTPVQKSMKAVCP